MSVCMHDIFNSVILHEFYVCTPYSYRYKDLAGVSSPGRLEATLYRFEY